MNAAPGVTGGRLLIVNADDFGMYPGINAAVVEAFDHGIVTSLFGDGPHPGRRRGDRGPASTARPPVRGAPHAGPGRGLARMGPGGRPGRGAVARRRHRRLPARGRVEEVEIELRAQIRTVLDAGLAPTHLDWHCLADGGRADLSDLAWALADEHGLAVRVWLEPALRKAREQGRPVIDHPFLDSFTLDVDGKTAAGVDLLRRLPPGLSEWAVHPGRADAPSRALDEGWRVRSTDLAFLTSPQARDVAREEGIELVDYSALSAAGQ